MFGLTLALTLGPSRLALRNQPRSQQGLARRVTVQEGGLAGLRVRWKRRWTMVAGAAVAFMLCNLDRYVDAPVLLATCVRGVCLATLQPVGALPPFFLLLAWQTVFLLNKALTSLLPLAVEWPPQPMT
jgi:hypothetical protein